MNIPPPFEGLENEFPMVKEAYDIEKYQDIFDFSSKFLNKKGKSNIVN